MQSNTFEQTNALELAIVTDHPGSQEPICINSDSEPIMEDTAYIITDEGREVLDQRSLSNRPDRKEMNEYTAYALEQDCPEVYRKVCRQFNAGYTPAQIELAAIRAGHVAEFAQMMRWTAQHLLDNQTLDQQKEGK